MVIFSHVIWDSQMEYLEDFIAKRLILERSALLDLTR